jgi:hypothetical protein
MGSEIDKLATILRDAFQGGSCDDSEFSSSNLSKYSNAFDELRRLLIAVGFDDWLQTNTIAVGTGTNKANKYEIAFYGVEPLPLIVNGFGYGIKESRDIWLHPVLKEDVTAEAWNLVTQRAAGETMINDITRFHLTIITVRLTLGWDKLADNIIFRKLRYYAIEWHGGEIPFIEQRGRIKSIAKDAMVSKRIYTGINILFKNALYPEEDRMPIDVQNEIFDFLFKDPYGNGVLIKKNTTLLRFMGFALTTGGSCIIWDTPDKLTDPVRTWISRAVEVNDSEYYNAFIDDVYEERRWMADNLPLTFDYFWPLITADMNRHTIRKYQQLGEMVSYAGYTYSQGALTHIAEVKDAEEEFSELERKYRLDVKEPQYAPLVRGHWAQYGKWLAGDFTEGIPPVPSSHNFPSTFVNSLTSSSPGTLKAKGYLPLNDELRRATAGIRKFGEDTFTINLSTKLLAGLADPYKFMSSREMLKIYDIANPGLVGERTVPGAKPNRLITAVQLAHFYSMLQLQVQIQEYNNGFFDYDTPFLEPNLTMPTTFQEPRQTGNVLSDHNRGLWLTGRACLKDEPVRYVIDADLSSFDKSKRWLNYRQYMIQGILGGLGPLSEKLKFTQPFAYSDMKDWIQSIWGKVLKYPVFDMGPAAGQYVELTQSERLMTLNQELSGVATTLSDNTIAHSALQELMRARIADLGLPITFWTVAIMGDDVETTMIADRKLRPMEIKLLNETIALVAEENGFKTNVTKTVSRSTFTEFLKKFSIGGRHVPLRQMQELSAEGWQSNDVITTFSALIGKLATSVSRGASEKLINAYLRFKWLFFGGLKMRTMRNAPDRWVYYPLQALYIPREIGGIGRLPWTILMASNGNIIAYYTRLLKDYDDWLRDTAWVIEPVSLRIDDLLLDALTKDDARVEFTDGTVRNDAPVFGNALKFLTSQPFLNENRLKLSDEHSTEFENTKWQQFGYRVSGELWLKSVVGQSTLQDSRELLFATKQSVRMLGRATLLEEGKSRVKRSLIKLVFPFVNSFTFVPGSDMSVKVTGAETLSEALNMAHPFDYMDDKTLSYIIMCGFGEIIDNQTATVEALLRLLRKRDPLAPRAINEGNLLSLLKTPQAQNVDSLTRALIHSGFKEENALDFASRVAGNADRYEYSAAMENVSLRDAVGLLVDLSPQVYIEEDTFADMRSGPTRNVITMAIQFAIAEGLRHGVWKKQYVITEKSFAFIENMLSDAKIQPIDLYINNVGKPMSVEQMQAYSMRQHGFKQECFL